MANYVKQSGQLLIMNFADIMPLLRKEHIIARLYQKTRTLPSVHITAREELCYRSKKSSF